MVAAEFHESIQSATHQPRLFYLRFRRFRDAFCRPNGKTIYRAAAWSGWVTGPAGDLAQANSDEEIDEYVRRNSGSTCHAVGTAAISAVDAPFGVVNPDLSVKGVKGLRVIDASIFPFIPAAHPQVPIYIVAEQASDFIKDIWA